MSTHDIFLSYSNKDRERIIPIVKRLQQEGWKVWWDVYIPHGKTFDDVIEENLDASRCVVVCWSEHSVKSRWVKTEAGEGAAREMLIPMKIDKVKLPLAFRRIQTANLIDFSPGQIHQEFEKFIDSIHDMLGTESQDQNSSQSNQTVIVDTNSFTDPRDGQVYRTVKLKDGKTWMAQNLNFDMGDGCWFYKNGKKDGTQYGRLYTWEAAKKACSPGWHLPGDEEWKALAKAYGGYYDWAISKDISDPKSAYKTLIEGGSSGFSALLGGLRDSNGSFDHLGDYGRYWSSTENGSDCAWYYLFHKPRRQLGRGYYDKPWGFSYRCIQDD